jgi:hypothetical protein
MSSVPPDVLDRLRKMAGMLGSEHDGERAAASSMITRILVQHGCTWDEFISGKLNPPEIPESVRFHQPGHQRRRRGDTPPPPPPPPPPEPDWQDADPVVIPPDCPTEQFDDRVLRALAARAVDEDARGLYNLNGTDFLQDVGPLRSWTERQRIGLVKSLRRAWVIRRQAGYR